MSRICIFFVVFLATLFAFSVELQAQRRGGGGGRRGARSQAAVLEAATAGTVPELTDASTGNVPHLEVVDANRGESIVPVIPEKVIRYATRLFDKYDTNRDGFLQREEWSKMPGAPHSMDLDGDYVITLEEFLRHIAIYGRARTIQRPDPPGTGQRTAPLLGSPFRPLSAPLRTETKDSPIDSAESAEGMETPDSPNGPGEEIDENRILGEPAKSEGDEGAEKSLESQSPGDEELDALSYEKLFGDKFKSSPRKYHVPLGELRGVPNWFVIRDRDGDGQLSLLEYDPTLSARGLAAFGRMDKNNDGFLTAEEVREALQKQRQQTQP